MICPVCHSEKDVEQLWYDGTHAEGRPSHGDGSIGSVSDVTTYYKCNLCNGFIKHRVKTENGKFIKIQLDYDINPQLTAHTYA